jgi:hypothetical protein
MTAPTSSATPSSEPATEAPAAALANPAQPSDLMSLKAAFTQTRSLSFEVDGVPLVIRYRRHNRRESEMVKRVLRRTLVKRNADGVVDILDPEAEKSKVLQGLRADALSIYLGWEQIRNELGIHNLDEVADDDAQIDKIREFLESNFPEALLVALRSLIESSSDGVSRLAQGF